MPPSMQDSPVSFDGFAAATGSLHPSSSISPTIQSNKKYVYIYIPHKPLVQLEVLRLVQESVYAVYNPDWAGNVTTNGFQ